WTLDKPIIAGHGASLLSFPQPEQQSPGGSRLSRSGGDTAAEVVLALLGALAALGLGAAEEVGQLGVPRALGVVDVRLQAQRVAQALLDEPDQVVVLVLRPGDPAGLLYGAHLL